MGMYYAVSIMHVIAVKEEYKQTAQMPRALSVMKTVGILLLLLTFILTGTICLSLKYNLPKHYDTIIINGIRVLAKVISPCGIPIHIEYPDIKTAD